MAQSPLWATESPSLGLCWSFQEESSLSLGSGTLRIRVWSCRENLPEAATKQREAGVEDGAVHLARLNLGLHSGRKWILTFQVIWGLSFVFKLVWAVFLLVLTQTNWRLQCDGVDIRNHFSFYLTFARFPRSDIYVCWSRKLYLLVWIMGLSHSFLVGYRMHCMPLLFFLLPISKWQTQTRGLVLFQKHQ